MLYLITYDITSNTTRTKLAKALAGYGQRVQYSVFECELPAEEITEFRRKLADYLHEEDGDSIRIYPLPENVTRQITILGCGEIYEPDQLLIF